MRRSASPHPLPGRFARGAQFAAFRVRVQQIELRLAAQQRLVVVRTVHVHEPVADLREHGQRNRRPVRELTVRTRGADDPAHDEFVVRNVGARLFQDARDREIAGRRQDSFHQAPVRARPDDRAIRPLPHQQ